MMLERCWLDDLKIHDIAQLGTLNYQLRGTNLGSGPAPRNVSEERPRGHGSVNRTRFYAARIVQLQGYCDAGTPQATRAALDEIKKRIRLDGAAAVLKFRGYGEAADERLEVVQAGPFDAPGEGWMPFVRWAVVLEAPDPRIYSDTLSSGSYDPAAEAQEGITFPLVFPLVFAGESSSWLAVTNAGTIETPPTLTIQGPTTTIVAIDNDTTGESIYFTSAPALGVGETIVVDVARRRVTANGIVAPEIIDARRTTWFELEPGQNLLRLRGTGFVSGTTELEATFRSART